MEQCSHQFMFAYGVVSEIALECKHCDFCMTDEQVLQMIQRLYDHDQSILDLAEVE